MQIHFIFILVMVYIQYIAYLRNVFKLYFNFEQLTPTQSSSSSRIRRDCSLSFKLLLTIMSHANVIILHEMIRTYWLKTDLTKQYFIFLCFFISGKTLCWELWINKTNKLQLNQTKYFKMSYSTFYENLSKGIW